MAISAQVDYRPQTGRIIVTIDTDAGYNPDAIDDIARRVTETLTRSIEKLPDHWADDEECDDTTQG